MSTTINMAMAVAKIL